MTREVSTARRTGHGLRAHVLRVLEQPERVRTARAVERPVVELPEDWKGAAPAKRATGGNRFPHTKRGYAELICRYYLGSSQLPKALWALVDEHDTSWWYELHGKPKPPPSTLLLPRMRVMLDENRSDLPQACVDEIARLLRAAAEATREYRPEWADRLMLYRRELLAA